MRDKILFITFFYLLLSFHVKCENTYRIKNLTTKDGLSQNTISSIIQDRQGFLWFGSLNGLNRFDGNEFLCLHPQYELKNTLSDSRIKKIHEDSYGYIWIRTNIDNINCYDPKQEKFIDIHPWSTQHQDILFANNGDIWLWGEKTGCLRVMHTNEGITSHFFGYRTLDDYTVNFVQEDKNSVIWIGTNSGLFIYDKQKLIRIATGLNFHSLIELKSEVYVFTNNNIIYSIDKATKKIISEIPHRFNKNGEYINNTTLLSDKNILITTNEGSFIFYTETQYFGSANKLFNNKPLINAFIQHDNKNHIWVYNKSGIIWQYNSIKNQFKPYNLIPSSIVSNIDMERYSIFHDSRNIIWITTYGNGLFAIDQTNGTLKHFFHDKNQLDGLSTNYLLSVTEDKSGNIWIGTEHSGISKITITKNQYQPFYPGDSTSKNENKIVRLVYEDSNENLWIGTKSGCLFIYDKNHKLIAHHQLKGGMPYTLAEDNMGNKWIGTKGNGLIIFKNNEYYNFHTYNREFLELSPLAINIYAAHMDNKGRMWLGTYGHGLILAKFKNNKLELQEFPSLLKFQNKIRTIEQDNDSLIWLGGNNGITVFDPDLLLIKRAKVKIFYFDTQNDSSLNNNEVKNIFKDSNGKLWIGTSGGGVNQVIQDSKLKNIRFRHFTSTQGLINNIVQGIEEDDNKNLWITTESGISIMHPKTEYFENYHLSNKWEGDLFCESAIHKCKSGEMLLGSFDGLYTITPNELNYHINKETVILTELRINGIKAVSGEENSPLKKSITNTSDIQLQYNQNSFNIKFSVLNYNSSNIYTYILDGYETNWNSSTQHNEATYRNIPPGEYTFRVKTSNVGGNSDQKETQLQITINQPIWKSTQAFIFYILLFSLVAFIIFRTNKRIYSLNTAVKLEQQLTNYKLRFFTNISHEFRTPLTIIKGTIDHLASQENISEPIKKQIAYLEKSSNRLLRLINQLLDYQKIQNEQIELEEEPTEAINFFKEIYQTFEEIAKRKNITYNLTSNTTSYNTLIDRSKVEKVAYNLLSNAFKFVSDNGIIIFDIVINDKSKTLKFSVSDNGKGISPEDQGILFTRFKQINPSDSGTGIGLNFAYELVKIHNGSIKYKDTPDGGATFIVSLPLHNCNTNHISPATQKSIKPISLADFNTTRQNLSNHTNLNSLTNIDSKYKNYKLLIIEDDIEVSDFLSDYLLQYFDVETAIDGLDGLKKCKLINPQLIICDAMMPKMNGYEVVNRIKSEFQTCHIPVIMLTAYATPQHQLKGIASGADSYITKPYNSQYLLARVVKLLEQRETLQRKFAKEPGLIVEPNLPVNKDNDFIKKINLIIEKNMDNAEFSIDHFYENMSMGRTIFYKKVKSLTGFTPNEYLRVIRMKKAAELLTTTQLNVSEVAFKVGHNNPFYFSKCFKNQFGISPSEYAKGKTIKG